MKSDDPGAAIDATTIPVLFGKFHGTRVPREGAKPFWEFVDHNVERRDAHLTCIGIEPAPELPRRHLYRLTFVLLDGERRGFYVPKLMTDDEVARKIAKGDWE